MSHAVVFRNTSIHALIKGDDGEDRIILHLRAMDGFVSLHVPLALFLDDGLRKSKIYLSIEHSSLVVRAFMCIVALEGRNVIAQKPCRFCTRMGNERFRLRKFELEALLKKRSQLSLDFLSFFLWPDKSQQKIIRIPP